MLGKPRQYVQSINEISKSDIGAIGELAYINSQINIAKISMPNCIVINSYAFDEFLLYNQLVTDIVAELSTVEPFIKETAKLASGKIINKILSSSIQPELLSQIEESIRLLGNGTTQMSVSIEASDVVKSKFLPENRNLTKFVDVSGIENICHSIKMVWASLFTEESLEHRANLYYKDELTIAVLVKRSVMSEISGKVYTLPPITKETDLVEINAFYGTENATADTYSSADVYTVNRKTKSIVERKIVPQKEMLIRKKKDINSGDKYINIQISPEWQRRPKLQDEQIELIFKKALELEKIFKSPLEIVWGIQAGEWFVINVSKQKFDSSAQSINQDIINAAIEHSDVKKTKKATYDIDDIEKEVLEILSGRPNVDIEAQSAQKSIDKIYTNLVKTKGGKTADLEVNPTEWTITLGLRTRLYLDITKLSPSQLNAVEKYNGGYLDGTNVILNYDKLVEYNPEDKNSLETTYSIDMQVALQNVFPKQFIYSLSNIHSEEKKLLGLVDFEQKHSGDERFILDSLALETELNSFANAKKVNLKEMVTTIVIPSIRNVENLEKIVKKIKAHKISDLPNIRLVAEVSIPSFIRDISEIPQGLVDGLLINFDTLGCLLLYKETLSVEDYPVVSKYLQIISKDIKALGIPFGYKVDFLSNQIVDCIMPTKPNFVVTSNILDSKTVEYLDKFEEKIY